MDKKMNIGILVSFMNNFGQKGLYNSQEIGLAKALSKLGHKVIIYKAINIKCQIPEDEADNRISIQYCPVKKIGINGLVDISILDTELDKLIYFSDTQLSVPKVYRWCKKNAVVFIPYIGALESHSPNKLTAFVMNTLSRRNIEVYKKSICLSKNVEIQSRLNAMGVNNALLAPVGIDMELLYQAYRNADTNTLRETFGFGEHDRIVLFIGRLEQEKRPLELVEIFSQLYASDNTYRLIIVGKGYLYHNMMNRINALKIGNAVKYIEKIPNDQIWQLYRISDVFVNLNKQEIFGMVLMEAMFYEANLVAFHAPGPDYIIENGVSGVLVNSSEEMLDAIQNLNPEMGESAHNRVVNNLTWDTTASIIEKIS